MTRLFFSRVTGKENYNTDIAKCFSGEELTNNVNGDENTIRNCEEKKEKTDSEIHMPTNIQEHKKVQNFRRRQNFLKATCSQGLYSYFYIGKGLHDQA